MTKIFIRLLNGTKNGEYIPDLSAIAIEHFINAIAIKVKQAIVTILPALLFIVLFKLVLDSTTIIN